MYTNIIARENIPFLEKIMHEGRLNDLGEARNLTKIVFRTIRDFIPAKVIKRVELELLDKAVLIEDKSHQLNEIATLWKDPNPLVGWLSRFRRPFKNIAFLGMDANLFLIRVEKEGGVPKSTDVETVIKAVFQAIQEELSVKVIGEIGYFLPGKIQQWWQQI
ncbi:MAG: DUF2267 domain-containing protein [Prochloraceae cyanobacterium]